MLNDNFGFKRVYLALGYTDLRGGVEKLASLVKYKYSLDPYDKNTLFLFCGKRPDRIKGLLWEGDGFLLLYKRLTIGAFDWPRSSEEAMEVSEEQYKLLMQGMSIVAKRPIHEAEVPKYLI